MSGSAADAELDAYLAALRRQIDATLAAIAKGFPAPPPLDGALAYALLGPGKRLRPCLTLAVAEALAARDGRDPEDARAAALPAACAVELVHTYSLVHDDLPAMDDDALRRGRATTHVVYGDGLAILAGDGLLTEAFGLIAQPTAPPFAAAALDIEPARRLQGITVLASAAGVSGMVGGQAIDLAAAGRVPQARAALDAAGLEDMHTRKTGALIRASCVLGAIVTGADGAAIDAIDAYARDLGLAFQIVDDLLDVVGTNDALGKTAGKDAAAGKPTFVSLYGVADSRRRAADCVARATHALDGARLAGRLAEIAQWSLGRTA